MQIMPLLALFPPHYSLIQSSVSFSAVKPSLSVALSQCDSFYRGVFSALSVYLFATSTIPWESAVCYKVWHPESGSPHIPLCPVSLMKSKTNTKNQNVFVVTEKSGPTLPLNSSVFVAALPSELWGSSFDTLMEVNQKDAGRFSC